MNNKVLMRLYSKFMYYIYKGGRFPIMTAINTGTKQNKKSNNFRKNNTKELQQICIEFQSEIFEREAPLTPVHTHIGKQSFCTFQKKNYN